MDELITKIGEAKNIARERHLWKTFKALDNAEKECGWEIANSTKKNRINDNGNMR